MENFNEYKLDALLITETWLQNTVEDDVWLQASEFHKDGHEISNISRQDKRIEGIALLYSTKKNKIKTVAHKKYHSFESGVWLIQFGSTHYTILGVYHLLVGTQQGITNSIFIDALTELLMEIVSNHNNIIILGDINIHLNDPEGTDAEALCDIFEAFNIMQHRKFPTHNLGHTLDMIATEIRQKRNVTVIPSQIINCHSTQRQKTTKQNK